MKGSIAVQPIRRPGSVIKRRNSSCAVCKASDPLQVLDLPALPLTGIYLEHPSSAKVPPVDQGLLLCRCGHAQLMNILDPSFVYDATYTHRASLSPIATGGNEFFCQFLKNVVGRRRFKRVVDVGCNDLYLLRKLEPLGKRLLGIDPIWRGREPEPSAKTKVLGRFIEEVDLEEELEGQPDLIVSTHTLEHLEDPRIQLERLVAKASPDAWFFIEVPSLDTLLEINRFDQVFHQHIQYFSLASFERMVRELGCELVEAKFNWGMWGGTMLTAFRKLPGRSRPTPRPGPRKPSAALVRTSFKRFRAQLRGALDAVEGLGGLPIYGFGAAQMLPTLAYHLESDLGFLEAIYDDDPRREGLCYPSLRPQIQRPAPETVLDNAGVLVTALDSTRPILKRLLPMRPRRIIIPVASI